MRQAFFGLNIAIRGLYTAQRSLDVVNHNLTNITTPGYSRQSTEQSATRPLALNDGTGMVGTGAEVTAVGRTRDEYLDYKYWSENVSYGEWENKSSLLSDIEATFNEPSESGFTKILNTFYSSMQELAKDPSSPAVRALVKENGVTVAKYFNSTAEHFEKLQADLNYRVNTTVSEINSYAVQIQQLNRQIYTAEFDGSSANDLRDERTLMVDKLSKLINIEASEVLTGKLPNGKEDRHFLVTVSGKPLVNHFYVSKLNAAQRKGKLNAEDTGSLYEVGWADGNDLEIKGGALKGLLDVRDGKNGSPAESGYEGLQKNSPLFKGIPFYLSEMNKFVRTYAKAFNEGFINGADKAGHADGYTLNSAAGDPASGIRFFTMLDSKRQPMSSNEFIDGASGMADISTRYDLMTAKNFAVSSDITSDTSLISVADKPGEKGNLENLNSLIDMRHDAMMFSEGAPEDFMKSLVTTIGIESQFAETLSDNQNLIVKQVDNRRLSTSGVSIDEEMASLVKYQHAYNASAKMITTMAEIYDTLINRMGV